MTDENERFIAKYVEMGEDEVRSKLAQGIISGRGILPAEEFLRRIDAERDAQDRASRRSAQAEQTALARSAADSAREAAEAARSQADAARAANQIAHKANIIATLALIAAALAIAVSIIGVFLG